MGLHSYYVKYIARSGDTARRFVVASSSAEARRKASADGCEDILGARRAKVFTRCIWGSAAVAVIVTLIWLLI